MFRERRCGRGSPVDGDLSRPVRFGLEERVGFGLALGACLMGGVFLVEWATGWVRVTGTLVTREGSLAFWPGILVPKWRREVADARLRIS